MPDSKRDLARKVEHVRQETGDGGPGGVRVEWGEPAPEDRPDGMTWTPADGDEPATLRYDLWAAQERTLATLQDGEADLVAFLAGYGSGKSMFGARWLVAQALAYPGSRFLAMGISYQKARQSTYPKLYEALPGERTDLVTTAYNGPETSPIVTDYNRSEHRLTLTNDSEIVLGSADSWNRYAGAEFGAIWMDEPSHYGEVLHDLTGMMTTRLRGVDGPKQMLWTLTGEGYNAAWEILEKRQDADGQPIGLDIDIETASVLENPYLSDGEKERFKRKYAGTGKETQALHGGFAAASGLVYSNFSREDHVIPPAKARDLVTDDERIYGYDAGWNDPRVLLEIGKTAYDQLVVLDEFHQSESHVDDAIRWLEVNDKPDGVIYAEHVPAELERFRAAGWTVVEAEKDLDAGLAEVRRRLQPDGNAAVEPDTGKPSAAVTWGSSPPLLAGSYNSETGEFTASTYGGDDGDDPDPEHGTRVGLLVSAKCSHLVREFLGYKEEHVGTSTATDHCLDSLRYAVMGVSGAETDGGTVVRRSGQATRSEHYE